MKDQMLSVKLSHINTIGSGSNLGFLFILNDPKRQLAAAGYSVFPMLIGNMFNLETMTKETVSSLNLLLNFKADISTYQSR